MKTSRVKTTDNPKLKTKKLSDGTLRYYLEFYKGYNLVNGQPRPIREKKFLPLTILERPRTPMIFLRII